jgi:hypothetical protein
MNKTNRRNRVEKGSGSVFRDLGLPHPEREQLEADLTLQIYRFIRQRGLTQAEGRPDPPDQEAARLRAHARTVRCLSVERLMQFLTVLGQDVQVTVA